MFNKQYRNTKGIQVIGRVIIIFLIIMVGSYTALAQLDLRSFGNSSQRRSRSNTPAQKTPLPNSELNLKDIPYRIVYESYRETNGKNNWELCLINADGTNLINLTNTPDVDEFYPHASPDGTKICFVADEGKDRRTKSRNVYFMNIDGTGLTKVADNARQPCWSGDGKYIAYLKGEYSRYNSSSSSNKGLEMYNLETKQTQQHPNTKLRMLFNLCWSPDGKWFTATSRGGRRGNIAFRADNTTEMSLSIRGCRPDISPDGSRIAWGRSDQVLEIGTLDFSSRRNNVSNTKSVIACERRYKVYHVDWSPDGKFLTFSYGSSRGNQAVGKKAAGWNICIYDMETGKWTQITTDGKHNKEPDWVPVGSLEKDK